MSVNNTFQSKFIRTVVGVSAIFALMGAKGDGCGGETDPSQPTEPPGEICGPGEHLELICDDDCSDHGEPEWGSSVTVGSGGGYGDGMTTTGSGGYDEPMTVSTVGSGGYGEPMTTTGSGYPGDPGDCYEICVPDNVCGEGFYEELVCEGWCEEGPNVCLDPEGCQDELPPDECYEECWSECLPVDACGPGFIEDWICEGSEPTICFDPEGCPPMDGGGDDCYPICIPDEGYGGEGEPPLPLPEGGR